MDGHVARMGEKKLYVGFCWGKLKAIGYLEDLGLFGKPILN
jgi:hypothetical protein